MPDTKLRLTSKDLGMWTPQIAIHIWIAFVSVKKKIIKAALQQRAR